MKESAHSVHKMLLNEIGEAKQNLCPTQHFFDRSIHELGQCNMSAAH